MRLEFRILWFENQPQDVRTQLEEIEDYIRDAGFIPRVQMVVDTTTIAALTEQQRLYDDFDLVVVDYDLGDPGMNGDHVAEIVRRNFGFTDIIFYSGHKTVDLRKLVHDRQIDGVYCFARPDLPERLGMHIDQVVRRLSRLEAMRGLAMGTVGKCDDEFRSMLREEHASSSPEKQTEITAALVDLVANAAKLQSERFTACLTFEDKLVSRAVTSFHLQKLALLVSKGKKSCSVRRKDLTRYNEEVLSPRNTLGHAVETRGEAGWEVSSNGAPALSSADFPQLRRNMARHLENICSLRVLLDGERSAKS
ncbi:response regulator [Methylobacterium radiotolerans]|uniref:response regulator n=1 Tax=Methylobacterium radiotolerans TaxID=31998 RepID=UPI000D1ECB23|nr:response regulator [Methylobacterium radiotolerans]